MKLPREMRAYLRFARFLLWEFRWTLAVFWGLVLLGGVLLYVGYDKKSLGFDEACNVAFFLMFTQPSIDFPGTWYLQPLFFLLPLVGLGRWPTRLCGWGT